MLVYRSIIKSIMNPLTANEKMENTGAIWRRYRSRRMERKDGEQKNKEIQEKNGPGGDENGRKKREEEGETDGVKQIAEMGLEHQLSNDRFEVS
ncbi:MAG TPA: hypothetical protein VLN47_08725 [Clostridiaceae bacterium]|nr:hypothetical protein [Clostridiaceae bacterium]